jgi:putative IMPACT (imprinted ancient) family translation regulator
MPQSLTTPSTSELLIKKSRFIGCVQPVADGAAAQQVVVALRAQHPAAVDGGEPSGTAGRPMLDVLRHQDLEGVLATVVRYYGGVNLGTGGLVRTYTDCIAQALPGAEKAPVVRLSTLCCAMPYALEGTARRELEAASGTLGQVQHTAQVEITFTLPESAATPLVARLNETSHGQMRWVEVDEAT